MKRAIVLLGLFFVAALLVNAQSTVYVGDQGQTGILTVFPDIDAYKDFKATMDARYAQFQTLRTSTSLLGIGSTPTLADVHLNGEFVGKSPVGIVVRPGTYSVTVKSPGHVPYQTSLVALPGVEKNTQVVLKESEPGGYSFTLPVKDLAAKINPKAGFFVQSLVRDKNGFLYVVYSASYSGKGEYRRLGGDMWPYEYLLTDLGVAVSKDGGRTWTFLSKIAQDVPKPPVESSISATNKSTGYFTYRKWDGSTVYVPVRHTEKIEFITRQTTRLDFMAAAPSDDGGVTIFFRKIKTSVKSVGQTITKVYRNDNNHEMYDCGFGSYPDPIWKCFGRGARGISNEKYEQDLGLEKGTMSPPEVVEQNEYFHSDSTGSISSLAFPQPADSRLQQVWTHYLGRSDDRLYFDQPYLYDGPATQNNPLYPGLPGFGGFYMDPQYTKHNLISVKTDGSSLTTHAGFPYHQLYIGAKEPSFGVGDAPTYDASDLFAHPLDAPKKISRLEDGTALLTPVVDAKGNLHLGYIKSDYGAAGQILNLYYQFIPAESKPATVSVFTKPACDACDALKTYLSKASIAFSENPTLDGEMEGLIAKNVKQYGYPLTLVARGVEHDVIVGMDAVALNQQIGITFPLLVDRFVKGKWEASQQLFLTPTGSVGILARAPDGFRQYLRQSGTWVTKTVFKNVIHADFQGGAVFRGENQGPSNVISDPNDVEFFLRTDSKYTDGQFVDYYDFYTTRIKDASGPAEFSLVESIDSPASAFSTVLSSQKSYAYSGPVNGQPGFIHFSATEDTVLTESESMCPRKTNCIVFNPAAGSIAVKWLNSTIKISDRLGLSNSLTSIQLGYLSDEAHFFFNQTASKDPGLRKRDVNLHWTSNSVSYVGDITALTADVDLTRTDYDAEKQRFGGILSKNAYLIMKNKNLDAPKTEPFMTQFEFVYMLREAEKQAATTYGAGSASSVALSKSQWLRHYAGKGDAGFRRFETLVAVGTKPARMPLVDAFVPHWIQDSDSHLVDLRHLTGILALAEVPSADLASTWKSLKFTYANDTRFSYAYYSAYQSLALAGTPVTSDSLQAALHHAPSEQVLAILYARDLLPSVLQRTKLSDIFQDYWDSSAFQSAKKTGLKIQWQ